MRPYPFRLFITFILILGIFLPRLQENASAIELFPRYPVIEANVQFWEKVYGSYTTTQGILHDKNDLAIIYGVIDLVDWETLGASRINKTLIKLARHQYKSILADLGAGKQPRTSEEKKIAALFPRGLHRDYLNARDNIRLQIGQKDRFYKGVLRSGAYMPSFKKIFRSYNLPEELAYLPHVESSFNPKAHSKVGATGLWQFTSETGKRYLTINDELDERLDPFLSSQAAAKLLKENYTQLGSWPLALTAYNYGRAGMLRALREKKTYENIFTSHQTGVFQFASRNFYPEFVAALHVARRIERNPEIIRDQPEATISLRLQGFALAEDLRIYFRVAKEDFNRLNPALRQTVLDGKKYIPKGYLLRLPATKQVRLNVAAIGSRFYRPRQLNNQFYTVQPGDTAGGIAKKFALPLKTLLKENNLNQQGSIMVGQQLTIPGGQRKSNNSTIKILQSSAKQKP